MEIFAWISRRVVCAGGKSSCIVVTVGWTAGIAGTSSGRVTIAAQYRLIKPLEASMNAIVRTTPTRAMEIEKNNLSVDYLTSTSTTALRRCSGLLLLLK